MLFFLVCIFQVSSCSVFRAVMTTPACLRDVDASRVGDKNRSFHAKSIHELNLDSHESRITRKHFEYSQTHRHTIILWANVTSSNYWSEKHARTLSIDKVSLPLMETTYAPLMSCLALVTEESILCALILASMLQDVSMMIDTVRVKIETKVFNITLVFDALFDSMRKRTGK